MMTESESSRPRSPNYPNVTLEESIADVRKISKSVGKSALDMVGVSKAMGYTSDNGTARSHIASLVAYGLLDRIKKRHSVSDRARHIIHPVSEKSEVKALQDAFLTPPVFQRIYEEFKDCDEKLLAHNLLHLGFTEDGAEKAASVFKAGMAFTGLNDGDIVEADDENGDNESQNEGDSHNRQEGHENERNLNKPKIFQGSDAMSEPFAFPLADGIAYIQVPKNMSEQSYEMLMGYMKAAKAGLVRRVDDKQEPDTED